MKVTFVMGIAGSGKSTYIKENFKGVKVLDLYTYQEKLDFSKGNYYETILKSYNDLLEDIKTCVKNNEDVVVEHTFLKAIRRKPYIDAIREISKDSQIDIVLINPSIEVLIERKKERHIYRNKDDILMELEVLEIPTKKEGFNKIKIIN